MLLLWINSRYTGRVTVTVVAVASVQGYPIGPANLLTLGNTLLLRNGYLQRLKLREMDLSVLVAGESYACYE